MNIIIFSCCIAFCTIQIVSCNDIIVETDKGKVQGVIQESSVEGSYYAFKNIPYAKPPVASLRFKAPEDPEPWSEIHDATEFGPSCPNYNPLTNMLISGSENCLTLRVFSPDLSGSLPVIVYISGAAYSFDSDPDMYGPDYIVSKNVVLVTFNYRLGPSGFLSLGTEDVPGNAGLKDQVKVLEWVQKNIQNFGGDPNKVTIFGQSAGSASVGYHLASPMSRDLFENAILLSGSFACDAIYPFEVERKSYMLGNMLGVEAKTPSEFLLKLQDIPYEQFINISVPVLASEKTTNVLFKKMVDFVPVMEKDNSQKPFITENDMKNFETQDPKYAKNVLMGYTDQESLFVIDEYAESLVSLYKRYPELFVPSKILYNASPKIVLQLADKIRDYCFGSKDVSVDNMKEFVECTSWTNMIEEMLVLVEKVSPIMKTYLFKFSSYSSRNYYGTRGAKYNIPGVGHTDPAFYIFDPKPLGWTVKKDSEEYKMIDQIVTTVTNFAKTGNPSSDVFSWSPYTPESQNYVEFTDTMTLKQGPGGDQKRFWDEVYQSANIKFYSNSFYLKTSDFDYGLYLD